MNISGWRDIFRRFFCYVVTCNLLCVQDRTRSQPYCRGVWIDVLEEVDLPSSKSTEFWTLASYSYSLRKQGRLHPLLCFCLCSRLSRALAITHLRSPSQTQITNILTKSSNLNENHQIKTQITQLYI